MDPTAVRDRLVAVYGAAADPARAAPMRAYMRDQFPFLGIPTPARRALSREARRGEPKPTRGDLRTRAPACSAPPGPEDPAFTGDWPRRFAAPRPPGVLDTP